MLESEIKGLQDKCSVYLRKCETMETEIVEVQRRSTSVTTTSETWFAQISQSVFGSVMDPETTRRRLEGILADMKQLSFENKTVDCCSIITYTY